MTGKSSRAGILAETLNCVAEQTNRPANTWFCQKMHYRLLDDYKTCMAAAHRDDPFRARAVFNYLASAQCSGDSLRTSEGA